MLWLLLLSLLSLTDGKLYNLKVHRRIPQLDRHYHHDPKDYAVLSTLLMVGSGEAMMEFVIDTASADMQLTLCSSNPPISAQEPCYPYWSSKSFKRIDGTTATDSFNDDTGSTPMTFITRTPKTNFMGILGVGWPSLKRYPQDTFWPDAYRNDNNPAKLFSIKVGLKGCGAFFDFGSTDICNFEQSKATLTLPVTSTKYWQFDLKGAKIGKTIGTFSSQAVIASNREYIGMPKAFLTKFSADYGIQWDGLYGAYTVDCDRNVTLPDLKLTVEGGELSIRATEYVYTWKALPNGKCVVSFEDSGDYGFGPEWYFGLQIMQSYCIVFDYDNKQLRFRQNIYVDVDSCVH